MSSIATWIWYPADFEVWLGNKFNNRRTERGAMFPPFWKQDSHYATVEFSTRVTLAADEVVAVWAEGTFNVQIDGKLLSELSSPDLWYEEGEFFEGHRLRIPAGQHRLHFKVWNASTPPALFVDGPTVKSGPHWLCTYEDKLWIDEVGVAHGSGIYVPAASWNFNQPGTPPSKYQLRWSLARPQSSSRVGKGRLYDFGRETFGHLDFLRPAGTGLARIYYGESREEALDTAHCETLDAAAISNGRLHKPLASKAFRFVYIEDQGEATYELAMQEEFAPHDDALSGRFSCSDDELNRIWQVSARTLDLTTQEFFVDGIKRDRWTWSGDAIQSYLMNYYLRFDTECVKRTIRQLRGKDPVTAHVNTIMDYTFYWFKSIADYHLYTADTDFVRELWPRMQSLMDYVLSRTGADGLADGKADDWIFVDWVDFPMHKRGTLCFEQLLFAKALQTMAHCAMLVGSAEASRYEALAQQVLERTRQLFWSDTDHAFLHAVEDGRLNAQVTKFPNMMALLLGYATGQQARDIMQHVMLNPQVPAITTPYMRFYELESLCQAGLQATVLREMKDYWGGMLRLGATSFWEKYNPAERGAQHLAMYGRPYGKSLCHAWGASPLYLLGRYFLGVSPTKPGYAEYEVRPALGGLKWMEGTVPTPHGLVSVKMSLTHVEASFTPMALSPTTAGLSPTLPKGTLVVGNRRVDIPANQTVTLNL